jgi:hypothetical protein
MNEIGEGAFRGMAFSRRDITRIACALTMSMLALAATLAVGQERVIEKAEDGLAAWRSMESVLTHPRCLNCHTMTDYPRQGDDRRPHGLMVKRGPDGHGEGPKCQACHRDTNQAFTGIPGATDWHMAPLAFAWESEPGKPASGAAICATLKHTDDEDGEPDYERLIEYAQLASFVLWAWQPGQRPDGTERTTPLLTHAEFVEALKRWISAGAPCPGDGAGAEAPPAAPPPSETAPVEGAPVEGEPVQAAPGEAAPAEATSTKTAPVESSPSEVPPVEAAPGEAAPAEPAPAEAVPAQATPAEAAPTPTAPSETAPAQAAPTEATPADTAPAQASPAEAEPAPAGAPSEAAPAEAQPADAAPAQSAPVEAAPPEPAPAAAAPAEAAQAEPSQPDATPTGAQPADEPQP